MSQKTSDTSSSPGARFEKTRWTEILAVTDPRSPGYQKACEQFCQAYWRPVCSFVRKKGRRREEAEDLTQAFFMWLMEEQILAKVTREGGKFRSFLLTVLKNYLVSEWNGRQAQKRGGGVVHIPFDEITEACYQKELADHATPEALFDQKWAWAVVDQVFARLREEHQAPAKQRLLGCLRGCLPGAAKELSYDEASQALGMKIEAVRVTVRRLKRRYGELLREEVATPGMTPSEIDEELHYLMTVLGGR